MISINWRVLYTIAKGLLVSTGPMVDILTRCCMSAGDATFYVDTGGWALSVVGLVLLGEGATTKNTVAAVASLPPAEVQQALAKVPDAAKVLIAQAVPDVATVVIKDDAGGALRKLAESDAHRDIVTETQNEIDAKLGKKL